MKIAFQTILCYAKGAIFLFFALEASQLTAQSGFMQDANYNLSSFTIQQEYKNIEKLSFININSLSAVTHPDFGKIAPNAKPEWYEQYSKRTAKSRSFIAENGSVVKEYSYIPINYSDKNGNYIAINPQLVATANGWTAQHQEFPTFLYPDGSTEISLSGNDRMKYNFKNSIAGRNISTDNFTVGDNGMMIHEVIVGMDKRIIFKENSIETDYVLNKPLSGASGSGDLVISEEIILPPGYKLKKAVGSQHSAAGTEAYLKPAANCQLPTADYSEMVVVNATGAEYAHFKMPVCYDSNRERSKRKQSYCYGIYKVRNKDGKIFLDIIIPSSWINDTARVYPVTIDPVVTGPTALWAGGVINSCYVPNFNTATIDVTVPANITVTNFLVTASYYADPSAHAYESDGLLYFTSNCGREPSNPLYYYTVLSPGGDVSGMAYLNRQDIGGTEAFCLSPSCSEQTISLTMNLCRTYDFYGFYDCNASEIYYTPVTSHPFEAYIIGKSVELTGGANSWTISPTTFCSDVCRINMTANVSGGVPPYIMTHPWANGGVAFGAHIANTDISNGAGTLTLSIPGCPSSCGVVTSLSVPSPVIVDACGDTVSGITAKTVTQNPVPIIAQSPFAANVCSGAGIDIINTSCVAGSIITWAGSDGSNGMGNITDHVVNNDSLPITVNYTINDSADGCMAVANVAVTVNASFTINAGPDVTICPEVSTQIIVTGAPAGSAYIWTPSSYLSCICANPMADPANTTTYIVKATYPAIGGCTAFDTITVHVTPLTATAGQHDTLVCAGSPVQFNAEGGNSYIWTPSTGLSNPDIANPTAIDTARITYTVTISSGNCSTTATVTVNTFPALPTPEITLKGNDTLICSTSSQFSSYQWYDINGIIPGATDTIYIAPESGNYNLAVRDVNGCFISAGINIVINGVFQYGSSDNSIFLYPNPAGNKLTVSSQQLAGKKATIEFYNLPGQKVYGELPTADCQLPTVIDVSMLASGIYFLQLQLPERKWIGKFVKE